MKIRWGAFLESAGLTSGKVLSKPERIAHLNEGVQPIFACVGTLSDFESELSRDVHPFDIDDPSKNTDFVNWNASTGDLEKSGMRNDGDHTYVISQTNGRNKFSNKIGPCTVFVVAGTDRRTGEEISMMSHQSPTSVIVDTVEGTVEEDEVFFSDLSESLAELESRCIEGTVDVVLTGGIAGLKAFNDQYVDQIEMLSDKIKKRFGFEPLIIAGPKTEYTNLGDSVFYDTQHRRLYVIRPEDTEGKPVNSSLKPSDVRAESENW